MKTIPYSPDFPGLISPPAATYFDTLQLAGMERDEAAARLFVMDVLVKIAVDNAGAQLGFRAPENIFVEDVADKLGYEPGAQMSAEDRAVIDKATLVLRGDMGRNPIWDVASEAA